MNVADDKTWDVGVIVGRFQVDDFHEGHRELFDYVLARHAKTIVVIGRAPIPCSFMNPLDVQARTQMILQAFPQVFVTWVDDVRDDTLWSRSLDSKVRGVLGPNETAVLYGSRDSFTDTYNGSFDAIVLQPGVEASGTARRTEIARTAKASPDFRAGVIWASRQRYANPIPTVDIAIFKPDFSAILLGKRNHENGWRLPGGFVDATDENLRSAAAREAHEETSCIIKDIEYVDSFQQDDWRYHGEPNGILTNLFVATTLTAPIPGDDLDEVMWQSCKGFGAASTYPVIKEHQKLAVAAMSYVKRKGYLK